MKKLYQISGVLLFALSLFLIVSCQKERGALPGLTTAEVTCITQTKAVSGGIVRDEGGSPVIAKGICWNFSVNPTIYNYKTIDGSGPGPFKSDLLRLVPNTQFYLRAYGTNSAGTSYGNQVSFITLSDTTVTDVDGNVYNTIVIDAQTWMKENLKTTRFSDLSEIPLITSDLNWYLATSPGYCWYENDAKNKSSYGALYNWYSVDAGRNPNKNICPAGWHVPSDDEWNALMTYLGGDSAAVGKLKETGTFHWQAPNSDASDQMRFTALPGGCRDYDGTFYLIGYFGFWWSSTEFIPGGAWSRYLGWYGQGGSRHGNYESDGFSVRCIKDRNPGF